MELQRPLADARRELGSFEFHARDGTAARAVVLAVPGDELTPAELEQMGSVLQRAFGGWPTFELSAPPEEHLRWKVDGPARWTNVACLIKTDARVIGMGVDVGREVRVAGRDLFARVGADVAIDPEWQGLGVAAPSYQIEESHRRERYALMIGTGVRFRFAAYESLGNPLAVLVKVVAPRRLARTWRRQTGSRAPTVLVAAGLGAARAVATAWPGRRRHVHGSELQLRLVEHFDERVDELFERASEPFDFIVARRSDYLNWRFSEPGAGRYAVLLAEEGDALVGYAVYRIERDRGYLVDLLALPGRLDVVDVLVLHATRAMVEAGVAGIMCWFIARHPYAPILRRHGFINSRRNSHFNVQTESLAPEELAFLQTADARIHLTHGDTDVI